MYLFGNRLTLISDEARSAQGPSKPTLSQQVIVTINFCTLYYVLPASVYPQEGYHILGNPFDRGLRKDFLLFFYYK